MQKRQQGRWVGTVQPRRRLFGFQVGGLPGQRSPKWHTYPTREEAEREQAAALAALEQRREAAQALTFAEAIKGYCEERAEECNERSVETLRGRLRRFFGAGGARLDRPARITEAAAQGLYDALRPTVSVQEHRHCLSCYLYGLR